KYRLLVVAEAWRGLFQYKTVPFGLKNAPSVFQRMMDSILGALRWSHAVVYIDDIVVASTSVDEHVQALGTLLANATRAGLKFSPSKCTFAVPSLVLLGRKVSGAGVAVWEDRARAVSDLARPTTLRELYHVLGLFGYYRAFIKRFAELASPLTQLTRGWKYSAGSDGRYRLTNTEGSSVSADRSVLSWESAQQNSFDALKKAIATPPVLAHPDPDRPFVLYVDASKDAFAAILHQVFDEPATPRLQTVQSAVHPAMPVALLPSEIAKERWCSWLRSDRYFAPIVRKVENGSADDEWALSDGFLVRRVDDRLAIPEAAIPEILKSVHDRRGHFGFLKTYLAISKNFWRPSLSVAVRSWVKHCPVCLRTKRLPKVGSLDVDHDPQFPFHTISLDLLFGLNRSRAGNDAVLVILDVFSRMILLQPCASSVTAEGIAAIISDRVLRWGWRPRRLVSDSEARMTGSVMSALAKSLRAELTPSPPHHQQANAVERAIQTAQQVLQAMGTEDRTHWDRRLLPTVELAMNATPSSVTGFRPFDLIFVHHPDAAHAVFDSVDHAGVSSFADRLAVADERLQDARIAIQAAREEQKRRYDKRRQPIPPFAVDDQVYIRLRDRPVPGLLTSKIDPRKAGPYRICEVLSPHRVRFDLGVDSTIGDEFSVEQLDAVPRFPDPFVNAREGLDVPAIPALHDVEEDASVSTPIESVNGVSIELRERPVAFLSRLTSATERKMVAPELELCCLAWAYSRWAHWLEGASVTVVTDHAPLGSMLTSTTSIPYGPTISRCRALMLPHLTNLRFVHRAGNSHINVDALSRLPPAI
ncbi:hypothetical protein A4X06_0g8776, partial [Tilletia controversa]